MPDKYRILLKKRVAADLEHIFNTIAKDSPDNASTFVQKLLTAIDTLEIFPHRKIIEGQDPNESTAVRSLPVKPYLVFFRVMDSQRIVRILRVRHAARRPLKRFE